MLIKKIKQIVESAVIVSGFKTDILTKLDITYPKEPSFGDYSTSIALILSKVEKQNPMEIAAKICDVLNSQKDSFVSSAQVASPGFINIFVKSDQLLKNLSIVDAQDSDLKDKKIMVEYTDPNPFKEFHIGHLYSNTIGESLARLLESQGAKVIRACYQGDVGMHVACSVWGMTKLFDSERFTVKSEKPKDKIEEISKWPLAKRVSWLGACYAFGATKYKEDEGAAEEIRNLNAQIFIAAQKMHKEENRDFLPVVKYESLIKQEYISQDLVNRLYTTGRRWTLEYFETIYAKLGTKFDKYYFESEVGEYGYAMVKAHVEDKIFEESNGAIVFAGEKHGLHTRVLINSFGLPTYEAKELGLHPKKYKDTGFDKSIVVTGNEIAEYFKVMMKALSLIEPDIAAKTTHIPHGMVRLPEGKMSSRTGKVITGISLIEDVEERLKSKVYTSSKIFGESVELNDNNLEINTKPLPVYTEEVVQKLAVASIKYSFLKSNIGKDVVFNLEESLSFEGNSGPYILYTIVRCKSILEKAGSGLTATSLQNPDLLSQEDISLLRMLSKYHETVVQAAVRLAPHILSTYLHSLAKEFSAYYEKVNILKSEEAHRQLRLFLVTRVKDYLIKGSNLLGFAEVEKM